MTERHSPATDASAFGYQDRRLERTVLRTYRTVVDLDDLIPNERQPRQGPKADEELQRQIVANGGIFEPLLVEPHPDVPGLYRIIDGDRRWTNSKILVNEGHEDYRAIPVEITDRTLSEDERLRVWIYIHRQRKEWDAREKEMVANRLVDIVGRASAANILGITVRELDRLVEVFVLSERFQNLREPGAAITWARELNGLSKKLLTPTVIDTVVRKVGDKRITNSKDLRKLRQVLRDPIARAEFLADDGDIDTAMLRLPIPSSKKPTLLSQLDDAVQAMRAMPWTKVAELRGDASLIERLDEAESLIHHFRQTLVGTE